MKARLLKRIFHPIVRRAARSGFVGRQRHPQRPEKGRFTRGDVDDIVARSWQGYDKLVRDLPTDSPNLGNRLLLLLSCLTFSCFEVLLEMGVDKNRALELIGDTAWVIYQQWSRLPYAFARWRFCDPRKRLAACVRLFLRFPFSQPGYEFQILPSDDDAGISLDMHRCQVAEFFRKHEALELCRATWCNLDFALAEAWGGWLERSETLAEGCRRCDFRFKARDKGAQS